MKVYIGVILLKLPNIYNVAVICPVELIQRDTIVEQTIILDKHKYLFFLITQIELNLNIASSTEIRN